MRYALKFAYNGKNFYGYARQPNLKTVEGSILKILVRKGIIEDTKKSVFRSASRTDKGVSSLGNVISFNSSFYEDDILDSLSNESEDIIFYGIKKVPKNFNPRFAKLRQYRYYLRYNNLDIEKIVSSLSIFTGKHDFTNFARVEAHKESVRVIENIVYEKTKDFLIIDFFAPSFLWNQIRRIISALIKVGKNKVEKEDLISALYNPSKIVDFNVAPAKPLILKDIFYDFDFKIDNSQFEKVKNLEKKIISYI